MGEADTIRSQGLPRRGSRHDCGGRSPKRGGSTREGGAATGDPFDGLGTQCCCDDSGLGGEGWGDRWELGP